jgi:hypothetical protein
MNELDGKRGRDSDFLINFRAIKGETRGTNKRGRESDFGEWREGAKSDQKVTLVCLSCI